MTETKEVERRELREDGVYYELRAFASLWTAWRGATQLCAPSSYEFALERFLAGKRTNE
jgi:hypothetical protein